MYLSHIAIARIQRYREYYPVWSESVRKKNIYAVRKAHFWGQLLLAVSDFMLESINSRDMDFLMNCTNRPDLKKIYRKCDSLEELGKVIERYMIENYKENMETDEVLMNIAVVNAFLMYLRDGNTKEVKRQMEYLGAVFWTEMNWSDNNER